MEVWVLGGFEGWRGVVRSQSVRESSKALKNLGETSSLQEFSSDRSWVKRSEFAPRTMNERVIDSLAISWEGL
jgi:hypothetical protein